jgi:hypothetical protein
VVAVANHTQQYSTLTSMIPPLAIHGLCDILGITVIGLAMRSGNTVTVSRKETI